MWVQGRASPACGGAPGGAGQCVDHPSGNSTSAIANGDRDAGKRRDLTDEHRCGKQIDRRQIVSVLPRAAPDAYSQESSSILRMLSTRVRLSIIAHQLGGMRGAAEGEAGRQRKEQAPCRAAGGGEAVRKGAMSGWSAARGPPVGSVRRLSRMERAAVLRRSRIGGLTISGRLGSYLALTRPPERFAPLGQARPAHRPSPQRPVTCRSRPTGRPQFRHDPPQR